MRRAGTLAMLLGAILLLSGCQAPTPTWYRLTGEGTLEVGICRDVAFSKATVMFRVDTDDDWIRYEFDGPMVSLTEGDVVSLPSAEWIGPEIVLPSAEWWHFYVKINGARGALGFLKADQLVVGEWALAEGPASWCAPPDDEKP